MFSLQRCLQSLIKHPSFPSPSAAARTFRNFTDFADCKPDIANSKLSEPFDWARVFFMNVHPPSAPLRTPSKNSFFASASSPSKGSVARRHRFFADHTVSLFFSQCIADCQGKSLSRHMQMEHRDSSAMWEKKSLSRFRKGWSWLMCSVWFADKST